MALGKGGTTLMFSRFLRLCTKFLKRPAIFMLLSLALVGFLVGGSLLGGTQNEMGLYTGEPQLDQLLIPRGLRTIPQQKPSPSTHEVRSPVNKSISRPVNDTPEPSASHSLPIGNMMETTRVQTATDGPRKSQRAMDANTNKRSTGESRASTTVATIMTTAMPKLSRAMSAKHLRVPHQNSTNKVDVPTETAQVNTTVVTTDNFEERAGKDTSVGRLYTINMTAPRTQAPQPSKVARLIKTAGPTRETGLTVKKPTPSQIDQHLALPRVYELLYGGSTNGSQSASSRNRTDLQQCSSSPPRTGGDNRVFNYSFPIADLNRFNFHTTLGGSYSPSECVALQSVAVIVPHKNRREHLAILLLNLHPFLQKQPIEYTIFVVNQVRNGKFNKGVLLNAGATEALKRKKYDCLIFHDIDLLPENNNNLYLCPNSSVRHLSVAIDKLHYRLPYKTLLGGVIAIRWELFSKVNGYSNEFFGWGGEDDDFSHRCRALGVNITRYPNSIARYQMIRHSRDKGNEINPNRLQLLKTSSKRQGQDGLNSLTYRLDSVSEELLYTQLNIFSDEADTTQKSSQTKSLSKTPVTP